MILTSGTTGTPKGANRSQPEHLDPAAALFSKIPLRARETTMIAAPMFHSWGFAHFTLGLALARRSCCGASSTPRRRSRPSPSTRPTALAVVPVMLQRILELPDERIDRYDTLVAEVIAASGSALPGELADEGHGPLRRRALQPLRLDRGRLGDDRHARGHARRAGHRRPPAARHGRQALRRGRAARCPQGETGRIFVGNEMLFEGYTGGGGKDVIDGLMATGDVGHFDEGGRLFVDGRDDEMIVSGGENVFPREVEDLLARPRRRRRGRGHRRRGRGVRPAAEGLRRARQSGRSPPRTSSRST